MKKNNLSMVASEIKGLYCWLAQYGIADVGNPPRQVVRNGIQYIGFANDDKISGALHANQSYDKIFDFLKSSNAFSFKLLDGALLQLSYAFNHERIVKHRLAYYSCPKLPEYQEDLDLYDEEHLYDESLRRNTVPVPMRFDFDKNMCLPDTHPFSHLTLGQYKGCRIPVSAPLTPLQFVRFILMCFYRNLWEAYKNTYPVNDLRFEESIRGCEMSEVYVQVGNTSNCRNEQK